MIISHIDSSSTASSRRTKLELINVGKRFTFQGKVDCAHLAFGQTDFWALKDVSFAAFEGEVLGIIGRNGAGKTTCLNIIAGVLSPTEGTVSVEGKVLGLFNLGVGFQDELSGRENIFLNGAILGAERKEIEVKISQILEFSELGRFIDMPLGSYSQGMRLRLAFSIMASLDFDVLVIDEALAVGDMLFQNKCFERLMDFKRQGKTLIFTSQGMDVIERFCDRVALLDHGRLIFCGETRESINRYRELLNTQKFYVGAQETRGPLITETKKWADDISMWGQVTGAKEVKIDAIHFATRFKRTCDSILPSESLSVRIDFTVRDDVKEPHFGVAFFRQDGVYCYGPNTEFDGYVFQKLKKGKGFCIFSCPHINFAPGEYRISVAVWDKNEKIAYDYHDGCYRLKIAGPSQGGELLRLPYHQKAAGWQICFKKLFYGKDIVRRIIAAAQNEKNDLCVDIIKDVSFDILDSTGKKQSTFLTNALVQFYCSFVLSGNSPRSLECFFYLGLYRSDGVFCQMIAVPFNSRNKSTIEFPQFALLPGQYKISAGIWDARAKRFLWLRNKSIDLRMVFNRADHGTVYLDHSWRIGGYSNGIS